LPANVQQIMTDNKVASFNLGLTGATRNDRMGGLGQYVVNQTNKLSSGTVGFEKRFTSGVLETGSSPATRSTAATTRT
jgi:hypothetical protein